MDQNNLGANVRVKIKIVPVIIFFLLSWYESIPIGKETLCTMLANTCLCEAGIGRKPDHSLRATGAMEMSVANVPES